MKMQALIVVLAVLYWGLSSFAQSIITGHGACMDSAHDEPLMIAAASPQQPGEAICAPTE